MSQYLAEEIKKFHSRTIPLVDYPFEVKLLRWIVNTFLYNFYKDTFLYSTGVK